MKLSELLNVLKTAETAEEMDAGTRRNRSTDSGRTNHVRL